MESYRNKQALAEYSIFFQHVKDLREIPGLEHSTIWVMPEDNLCGHAALHEVVASRSDIPFCKIMNESSNRKFGAGMHKKGPGYHTDKSSKRVMVNKVKYALENDQLRFYESFITLGGRTREELIKDFFNQQRNYSLRLYPKKNPDDPPRESITGKLRFGMRDDIAMMLGMGLLAISLFFSDSGQYGSHWN